MLRTGSITTTLAVAIIATVGLVGGGYALVTGNSICSLASACDTKPAATQVADTTEKDCADAKASSCSSPKVVAASDASQCSKPGAKTIAASDKADCAAACSGAKAIAASDASQCTKPKAVNASDASQCSKPGAKTIAASDKADCAAACSGAKAIAASDASQCSDANTKTTQCDKGGIVKTVNINSAKDCATACDSAKAVAVADSKDCATACSDAKAVAASDASQCSKPGAKAIAASDKADCAAACDSAKAVAASDSKDCATACDGAKAVAVADYQCAADAKFSGDTMSKRAALHDALMPRIQGVREIEAGYALDFPACSDTLMKVAEMVAMGRDCCEFLNYQIVAESGGGAVHLVMTGDAGAKAFLAKALGPMVTQVSDAGCCDADGVKAVAAADAACVAACEGAKATNASDAASCDKASTCTKDSATQVKATNAMPRKDTGETELD